MPIVAVIPVKSFALGKQRLAGSLDPAARARLGRGLAEHLATTSTEAGLIPVIVTADAEVAEWALRTGFATVADPGEGLDVAAETGVGWAAASGSHWIVIHSDLPLLTTADMRALCDPLETGRPVLAPSSDGGTSAIGASGPAVFSFGVSSFHRHLIALNDPAVIVRPGLLLDIDSPDDLTAAATTERGRWVGDLTA